jgi:hypothetical protein
MQRRFFMHIESRLWTDLHLSPPLTSANADLVLAFGTRAQLTAPGVVDRLAAAFPQSVVCGCSTAGQFLADELTDDAIALTSVSFDRACVTAATLMMASASDSLEVGAKLAAELRTDDLRAVLILSDGTDCNGSALVEGLSRELDSSVTIFGGLAADGAAFESTVVLHDGIVAGGMVTAGPERTITASEDAVLQELDGEPALDLYSRYLGDRAADLPGSALLFPLAVHAPDADPSTAVVRTILGVNAETSSMTFAGNVPLGWKAQLMRANFDALVDGAEDASLSLAPSSDPDQALCIGVSCVGRRLVLGQRTDEELEAVLDALPSTATFTGFYSYGELAIGLSGRCELHNQTMTLTLISER